MEAEGRAGARTEGGAGVGTEGGAGAGTIICEQELGLGEG
jgi:hypothetical protein